ncbi:MAG: FmdB family zinc ribbon protein [Thauera sp.]
MPIYEYRCPNCGFQKEHLQKMSDDPLTTCPSCGASSYAKLLSAAGFQLKGSGWYATDFKGGGTPAAPASPASSTATSSDASPAAGCGGGCACH